MGNQNFSFSHLLIISAVAISTYYIFNHFKKLLNTRRNSAHADDNNVIVNINHNADSDTRTLTAAGDTDKECCDGPIASNGKNQNMLMPVGVVLVLVVSTSSYIKFNFNNCKCKAITMTISECKWIIIMIIIMSIRVGHNDNINK